VNPANTAAPAVKAKTSFPSLRVLVTGVALSSFAALLLELSLTRVFSVVLYYHFAFLVISIALLGLGAGGVFAYLWKARLASFDTCTLAAYLCIGNAIVLPLVLTIVLLPPVSLAFSSNVVRVALIYLTSAIPSSIPFFLTGLLLSTIFAREPEHIPRLYGADLVGAALACLGLVPLVNFLGGPNAILFAACVAALGGMVWARSRQLRVGSGGLAIALLILIAANHSGKVFDVTWAKGRFRDPAGVEYAKWNAISRVEVDRLGDKKNIVIDADASTLVMSADPNNWQGTQSQHDLMSTVPGVVNVLRPRGAFAIIGPGGGVDVLRAVANGSPSVTGIEINPIIANTIMRDRYADYSQHLYQRPQVHIHVSDGRSYLRNTSERFDVVQMTLVDTWASTAAGAFALSENNLYTVEAFREYFDHLRPDGMVAITRWEFRRPREALRVLSVAMEALHRTGVSDTSKNFMVVSQAELTTDGIPVLVLAKKSPFTTEEESVVRAHLAAYPRLAPLVLPSDPKLNAFSSLIATKDPYVFAAQYPFNVSPVTDNAPFFFFTIRPSQIRWHPHGEALSGNLGVAVLVLVLAFSVLAVLAFLVVPLSVRTGGAQHWTAPLPYFIAVGLGYIFVEIAFIQRFVLFLGHPTYALTVVIFLLLLSSGIGSLISRRWLKQTGRIWIPLVLIASFLLLYVFVLPALLSALVGLPFPAKLVVSGLLLAPLGFAMGMPFPTGLRALANSAIDSPNGQNAIEWAWAMNAASSVLGSVLAMVIAIEFGLNSTLACGVLTYLVALSLIPKLRETRAPRAATCIV
jgi:spermidine synthase